MCKNLLCRTLGLYLVLRIDNCALEIKFVIYFV